MISRLMKNILSAAFLTVLTVAGANAAEAFSDVGFVYDNFEYSKQFGTSISSLGTWTVESGSNVSLVLADCPVSGNNKVMYIGRTSASTESNNSRVNRKYLKNATGKIYTSCKMYIEEAQNMRAELLLWNGSGDSQAVFVSFERSLGGSCDIVMNTGAANEVRITNAFSFGQWYNIDIIADISANKYDFYLDGEKINASPIEFLYDVSYLSQIRFQLNKAFGGGSGIYIDEVAVGSASDSEIAEKVISAVSVPKQTKQDILLGQFLGTEIRIKSSDTQVIAADGTVTVPEEDCTVTLTVYATVGTAVKTKTFDVLIIGIRTGEKQKVLEALSQIIISKTAVSNITIPSVSDVSIEMKSSNTNVIGDDGTVIQSDTDKYATVTVTASYGSVTMSKAGRVCVPAKGTIGIYDEFNYSQVSGTPLSQIDGWTWTETVDDVTAYIEDDSDGKLLRIERTQSGDNSISVFAVKSSARALDGVVIASMRLKAGTDSMRFNVDLIGEATDGTKNAAEIGIDFLNGVIESKSGTSDGTYGQEPVYSGIMPQAGEWFDFSIVTNVGDNTFDLVLNGKKITQAPVSYCDKEVDGASDITAIKGIRYSINRYSQFTPGAADLYIDDILLRNLSEDAGVLSVAYDLLNIQEGYCVSDIVLPGAGLGTETVWTSSLPEVVASDGTLTRPMGNGDKAVQLSATITKGAQKIIKNFYVTVPCLPVYKIIRINYTDREGNVNSDASVCNTLTDVRIMNNENSQRKAMLAVAVYDGEELSDVIIEDIEIQGDISLNVDFQEGQKQLNFRAMLWDSARNMIPLAVKYDNRPMTETKIYIAGDSTACNYSENELPRTGWGMALNVIFDSHVTDVDNTQSRRRESAKSFIESGRLANVMDEIKYGDYLFVQFGLYDRLSDNPELYTSASDGEFEKYISQYVEMARAKGAIPVLLTPSVTYSFDENGNALNVVKDYSDAIKRVGEKLKADIIDVNAITYSELLNNKEGIKGYYMFSDENSNSESVFNEDGAKWICEIISRELSNTCIPIAKYLVSNN